LERRFHTLDATRIPVSRPKGQRSGSPSPLMLTYTVRHILRMARPTNFELGVYGWRTTTRISRRRYDLQDQRSRSHGHVISLNRVSPMAHKSKTKSRTITKIGTGYPTTRATLHMHQFQLYKIKGHICLLIRETKCRTCVIRGGRGHTVSAEPGGHTSCYYYYYCYYAMLSASNIL